MNTHTQFLLPPLQSSEQQRREGGLEDMEIQFDEEQSPLPVDEGDMEQVESEEGSSGDAEEGEEEEEGPPPRPGRRVTFEQRDRLAIEFEERDMYQHSEFVWCMKVTVWFFVYRESPIHCQFVLPVKLPLVSITVCRFKREGPGHDSCIPEGVQQHES